MSVDDLNKMLTASKWVLGILAVLIAVAGIFNQWISDRIARLQVKEKIRAHEQLQVSEAELQRTKAKTAELEAKLAPRVLTETQQATIAKKLEHFAGTQFEFASYQEEAEVRALVLPLITTLLAAGWKGFPAREMLMGGLVQGVVIEYAPRKDQSLALAAAALGEALHTEGIAASTAPNSELDAYPDRIRVKVGKKP